MTNDEIKSGCKRIYREIKIAEEQLKLYREICKHEKTIEVNYSWRPGSIQLSDVCEYCGEHIRYK